MTRCRKPTILSLLLLLVLLLSPRPTAAQERGDWPIAGGRFFTQTANGQGGYAVVDDGEARFWSEFQRLGGLPNVGYPISRRFNHDGFVTQAFQKLVLQWRPDVGQAWPVNIFDELSWRGYDDLLYASYQTPYPLSQDLPGLTWAQVVANQQALLNTNSAIRSRYFSVRDPLAFFGLPTSRVEDMGNHYAIRTQRAVFQQWKEAVPWAARGQVTIANGGDLAKALGWLPLDATEPEPLLGTRPPATLVPPPTPAWYPETLLVGPGTPGRLYLVQSLNGQLFQRRLLISDDYGATWHSFVGGLPVAPECVRHVDMDYATADALYASTCQGIYRWTGTQWHLVSSLDSQRVAVTYGSPEQLWSIPYPPTPTDSYVLRSDDGGATWRPAATGLPFNYSGVGNVAVDPRAPHTIYVTRLIYRTQSALLRATADGPWETIPLPPALAARQGDTYRLALDGATGDLYLSATNQHSSLWRVPNPTEPDLSKVRWEKVVELTASLSNFALLASGWSPQGLALYATAQPNGNPPLALYRSLDGGHTWAKLAVNVD